MLLFLDIGDSENSENQISKDECKFYYILFMYVIDACIFNV